MQKTLKRFRRIDRDMIKIIAVIPMAIGHFTGFVWSGKTNPDDSLLLFLLTQMALIAPPIFFFFIAEGFRYTHSVKKYALRLLLFAVITQIPFCLTTSGTLLTEELFFYLNIFFTLFLGVVSLVICSSKLKLPLKIFFVLAADALTVIFSSQWMIFGIPMILAFYYFKDRPTIRLICFIVCAILDLLISYMSFEPVLRIEYFVTDLFFLVLGYAVVTVFYNGERGKYPKLSKWFFYIFYPVHLILIYIGQLCLDKF